MPRLPEACPLLRLALALELRATVPVRDLADDLEIAADARLRPRQLDEEARFLRVVRALVGVHCADRRRVEQLYPRRRRARPTIAVAARQAASREETRRARRSRARAARAVARSAR